MDTFRFGKTEGYMSYDSLKRSDKTLEGRVCLLYAVYWGHGYAEALFRDPGSNGPLCGPHLLYFNTISNLLSQPFIRGARNTCATVSGLIWTGDDLPQARRP